MLKLATSKDAATSLTSPVISFTVRFHWMHVHCILAPIRFCTMVWKPHRLHFESGTVQHCQTAGIARPRSSGDNYIITCSRSYRFVL